MPVILCYQRASASLPMAPHHALFEARMPSETPPHPSMPVETFHPFRSALRLIHPFFIRENEPSGKGFSRMSHGAPEPFGASMTPSPPSPLPPEVSARERSTPIPGLHPHGASPLGIEANLHEPVLRMVNVGPEPSDKICPPLIPIIQTPIMRKAAPMRHAP